MTEKTKLIGGPEKTVTWIWLDPEIGGQLNVEFYDFSELAQRTFGNDIAHIVTVNEMLKLYSLSKQDETSILAWVAKNFYSYYDIKKWLEENGIGFTRKIDLWA